MTTSLSRRNFLTSTAMAGASGMLAACAGQTVSPVPVLNVLQEVLGFLQTTCKVVADASAITAFISTFPIGTAAVTIANAICVVIGTGTPPVAGRLGSAAGRLGSVVIGGVTYPAVTLRGISIPYDRIGTRNAARLLSAPLGCVFIRGVCVPVGPSPF